MNAVATDRVGIFTKSGNRVGYIGPAGEYAGQRLIEVERIDGASTGKRMAIPVKSFVEASMHDE